MNAADIERLRNELKNLTIKISWMRNYDSSGCLDIAYGKLLETQREFDKVHDLYERMGWES